MTEALSQEAVQQENSFPVFLDSAQGKEGNPQGARVSLQNEMSNIFSNVPLNENIWQVSDEIRGKLTVICLQSNSSVTISAWFLSFSSPSLFIYMHTLLSFQALLLPPDLQ